jgi:hypothetical protein
VFAWIIGKILLARMPLDIIGILGHLITHPKITMRIAVSQCY